MLLLPESAHASAVAIVMVSHSSIALGATATADARPVVSSRQHRRWQSLLLPGDLQSTKRGAAFPDNGTISAVAVRLSTQPAAQVKRSCACVRVGVIAFRLLLGLIGSALRPGLNATILLPFAGACRFLAVAVAGER